MNGSGRRPFPSQVRGQCLCNCRQQRKLDRHIGLRPADPQYSALPVHILQSNSKDFGCAQTIRCQQQHDRIITLARRFRSRDRTQNLLHVAPRQIAWGPLIYPISRCDHPIGEISRQPSCHAQKSEKRSERTAGIRNRSFRKPGGKLPHKRIHICQSCPRNGLRSTPQLPEEATRGLDIAHQRAFRDPIVCSPVMAVFLQSTVTAVAHVSRATAAMAYPARPTRKPTREVHCWRGCGYPWSFVAL